MTDPSGVTGTSGLLVPVVGVRDVVRDVHYCFLIGTPAQGTYKVTLLKDPAKASLSVDIP